jgi:PPOX class probable FMN-dependent enzyme
MIYPVWRQQLSRSLHLSRSKPEAKYFQVATVSSSGLPSVRTMVFRDYADESNNLLAVTDIRSDKVSDWHKHAEAQVHWYFVKSREQYRLSCKIRLVFQNAAGDLQVLGDATTKNGKSVVAEDLAKSYRQQWQNLSTKAKEGFFCAAPKSEPVCTKQKDANVKGDKISPYFALLVFKPYYVDYLDLKTAPHTRVLYTAEEIPEDNAKASAWYSKDVNP